ncbi:MAG: HDOD domain-containing protein [Candidatus Accumulibacter sp.]|jgi:EAL and modified HD-GYP domain-containing signal transduction protein|nr:HDOD domain-containing protein [Accumulibacter sp.]
MSDTDPQDVFLARQPILDRQQQLFAYELLFRGASAGKGDSAGSLDGGLAPVPPAVIVDTFTELSLAEALGPYQGFIKADQGLLCGEQVSALPARTVVLEILDTVAQTPAMIAHCELLRQQGYILATHVRPESSEALDIEGKPLLKMVEFIKVDVGGAEADRLKRLVSALKPLRKTLLAEKVESDAKMRLCHELGFDLFQGYYFAQPTVKANESKRLQSSETALLRLLGLISQDADTVEIEAVFKQEPVLTLSLLRLTNSAGSGLTTRITSLRHAITLLGRRQLLRWLQLLLYSGASTSVPAVNPLLQLAATRGRLMELLVDHTSEIGQYGRDLVDQAFMAGILSLMSAILGAKSGEILAQLPLAAPVLEALGERRGVLGDLLTLVEALEDETPDKAAAVLGRLSGIDTACVNGCLTRALGWANNLAR